MVEVIKHIFGLCGDGHPSIIYGIGFIPVLLHFRNTVTSYVKTLLQHFGIGSHRNKTQP